MMGLSPMDLVGVFLGFLFTILVFSYLLGDNFLFRLTVYIFVGVSAGYVAAVAWYNVIYPQLVLPFTRLAVAEWWIVAIPLLLGGFLLMKASPRLGNLGSVSMGYLVGVGAATAIGGAVLGTLFPQMVATMDLFAPESLPGMSPTLLAEALIVFIATVTTLVYFHFGVNPRSEPVAQRSLVVDSLARIGNGFIAIALGALFAGVYAAALAAFVERWRFVGEFLLSFIGPQ